MSWTSIRRCRSIRMLSGVGGSSPGATSETRWLGASAMHVARHLLQIADVDHLGSCRLAGLREVADGRPIYMALPCHSCQTAPHPAEAARGSAACPRPRGPRAGRCGRLDHWSSRRPPRYSAGAGTTGAEPRSYGEPASGSGRQPGSHCSSSGQDQREYQRERDRQAVCRQRRPSNSADRPRP